MLSVAVAFTWWKSPLSQPLIDIANAWLAPVPARIGRVVDYGDCLALLVLPLCDVVARRPQSFRIAGAALRRMLAIPVTLATVLGISATSMVPIVQDFQIRKIDPTAELNRVAVENELVSVAKRFGLECVTCGTTATETHYRGKKLSMHYQFSDIRSVRVTVQALPSGPFFGSGDRDDLRNFCSAIKQRLPQADTDIEYVEQLPSRWPD
jgi:hypothetical protein